jgi:hypothetical protein
MDSERFDALSRRLGRGLGRRRLVAGVGVGLGLATLGLLRPRSAAATVSCDNCDYVCQQCAIRGVRVLCNLCAQCDLGACYECPGPVPCTGQP